MTDAQAVTEETFDQEVLSSDTPVLVDFWAEWCQPCHMVSPILDKIAEERQGQLKLVKINIDEQPPDRPALRDRVDSEHGALQGRRAGSRSARGPAQGSARTPARALRERRRVAGFLLINPRSATTPRARMSSSRPPKNAASTFTSSARTTTPPSSPAGPTPSARDGRRRRVARAGGAGGDRARPPFVCAPFGTRNHFARDIGLDRDDPIAALDSSAGGNGASTWAGSPRPLPRTTSASVTTRRSSTGESITGVEGRLCPAARPAPDDHEPRAPRPRRSTASAGRGQRRTGLEQRLQARAAVDRRAGAARRGRAHLYLATGWRFSEWDERACTSLTIDAARHRIEAVRRRAHGCSNAARVHDRARRATRPVACRARLRSRRGCAGTRRRPRGSRPDRKP